MTASTITMPVTCALRAKSVYSGSDRLSTVGAFTSPPTRSGPSCFGSAAGSAFASPLPVPPTVPPGVPPNTPPSCPPMTPPICPPTTPPSTPPFTPPSTPPGSPPASLLDEALVSVDGATFATVDVVGTTCGTSCGTSVGCTNFGVSCTTTGFGVAMCGALEPAGAGGGGGGGGGGAGAVVTKARIGFVSALILCVALAPTKMIAPMIAA